jgi:hypothetical protein
MPLNLKANPALAGLADRLKAQAKPATEPAPEPAVETTAEPEAEAPAAPPPKSAVGKSTSLAALAEELAANEAAAIEAMTAFEDTKARMKAALS